MTLKTLAQLKKNSSYISYLVNHIHIKIHRLELPLDPITDPIDYLNSATLYPKIYWKGKKSSATRLALGSAFSVSSVPSIQTTDTREALPRFFGAMFFDDLNLSHERLWDEFSPHCFFIPRIEIVLQENKMPMLYYHYLEEEANDPIEPWIEKITSLPLSPTSSYFHRVDSPSWKQWKEIVQHALEQFETTPLEKVVLARASHMIYEHTLNPYSILKQLLHSSYNCTLFAYLPSTSCAFIGASPEYLYEREGRTLRTEAVAGTRPRGNTPEEEERLGQELLQTDKEQREFNLVNTSLTHSLSFLCQHFTKAPCTVIKTASMQHLYNTFHGILHPLVDDSQLVKELHPTPALGGAPKALALNFLSSYEPFSRGLYAAPLGWISPHHSEICVAIRSALIKHRTMTLFSGAGIVKGSHPKEEWNELELKITSFLKLTR